MGQQPLPSNFVLLGAVLDLDGRTGHGWAQHLHEDGVIDDLGSQEFTAEHLEVVLASVLGQLNGPVGTTDWPTTVRAWFQPTLF